MNGGSKAHQLAALDRGPAFLLIEAGVRRGSSAGLRRPGRFFRARGRKCKHGQGRNGRSGDAGHDSA
jgi:hypothetical protein